MWNDIQTPIIKLTRQTLKCTLFQVNGSIYLPTAFDVPPNRLIEALANYLKRLPQIQPPQWAMYTKTGSHVQRPPHAKDWWYVRAASLLRKLYFHGPMGLSDLRTSYGGRKESGFGLAHQRRAGSSSIRKILTQLQAVGLVKKTAKGRILTPEGIRLCDRISSELLKEIAKQNSDISKLIV
jgi:small subunit ribosomal protein S19e